MPAKSEVIEAFLAEIEEEFYRTLKAETYPHFFGGRVEIKYSTKPALEIQIQEIRKPGPKLGQKFKKRIGPSKAAMKAMKEHEDFEV